MPRQRIGRERKDLSHSGAAQRCAEAVEGGTHYAVDVLSGRLVAAVAFRDPYSWRIDRINNAQPETVATKWS